VTFTTTDVTITHNGDSILAGHCTLATKLWHLDIQLSSKQLANAAIGTARPAKLVAFAHATMFSPILSTLAEAL